MNATYLDAIEVAAAAEGGTLITHIGLFDSGTELSGGSPAYARLAVAWTRTGGVLRPSADLLFDVPASTVDEWRGFDAATGGTDYGGAMLATPRTFGVQGQLRLRADQTSIPHTAAAG